MDVQIHRPMTDTADDLDLPETMYFCGVEMPLWANMWHHIDEGDISRIDDSPEHWLTLQWHLLCRIDHTGTIESEGSLEFLVCSQDLLTKALEDPDRTLSKIKDSIHPSIDPQKVYDGLITGLLSMIEIAQSRDTVFWTAGNESDQKALMEFIEKTKLPTDHPDHQTPPHAERYRRELELESEFRVTRLRKLAQSGNFSKTICQKLNAIKKPGTKN